MFESVSYLGLQQYWWVIISLLGSLLVFLMFVQGGQTLIYTIGKTKEERTMIVNTLGRKWEYTFTTLVTFGGAFFASFPLFYSTSFGGAYWVWLVILFAFTLQAVSYEFRTKSGNFLGQKTYEVFLFLNGALGTILIGAAVATFFTGSMFLVDKINITDLSGTRHPVISTWQTGWRGLEAITNPVNVALGLAVFCLARILGLLYFMNSVDDKNVFERSRKQLIVNAIPFLIFFLYFLVKLLLAKGFAYDPETKAVFMEPYKYLHNFLQMPLVLVIFLAGVLLVLLGIFGSILKTWTKGIWFTGTGTVLAVFGLLLVAGLNHTSYYPSVYDLQSSLTIENSSSSHYTLKIMSYVSLLVPVILVYIIYAWRALNRKKITVEEMKEEEQVY